MKDKQHPEKHFDINEIKDPSFLSELNYHSLNVLSEDIRNYIIKMTSLYGGHLSSNLGVVELTIALHKSFDFSKDKIIFDVGHQCYTHKILTGRKLDGLRTKDHISGFIKLTESPYDVYEAGHSSTSISAANGFAVTRDLNHENYSVVALIGDASIASGLAFEGLNNVAPSNHKVIIVLNDNDMSISKPVGGLSKFFRKISTAGGYNRFKQGYKKFMYKTKVGRYFYTVSTKIKNYIKRHLIPVTLFDNMGFTYIGPINGHNIKDMEKAFKQAKKSNKSVIVHVRTIKGKGYKYAENDSNGYWHGVTPFDIATGKPKHIDTTLISWSHQFADLLEEQFRKRDDLVLISPATVKGSGLDELFSKYSDRCIDVGIAEEHAVTLASGIAINHKHPIISIYSTFMQRAFDEISHDVARMNLNVTFIVDRSGLVGADGDTHQGIYDESFLLGTPNVTVSMPSNACEAKTLLEESLQCHGPFFIRFPRTYFLKQPVIDCMPIGYGDWIKVINDTGEEKFTIVGFGPILNDVVKLLKDRNITNVEVINAIYQNPINAKMYDLLMNKEKIFIFDAYATEAGFINKVKSKLMDLGYKGVVKSASVDMVFVKQASIEQQLQDFQLKPEQIVDAALKLFYI